MDDHEHILFIKLYNEYFDNLVLWCQSYVNFNSELKYYAEDWVHEAFVRAIKDKDTFITHENQYGWLVVACRHIADNAIQRRDVRRKHTTFSIDAPTAPDVVDLKASIDRWVETEFAADTLNAILKTLTTQELDIYNEIFVNDAKEAEAAAKFDKPLSAIKATVRRIRRKARSFRDGMTD